MDDARRTDPPAADPAAAERYLLLADISGYTGFLAGVERDHGIDFSAGVPAAYPVLAALLDSVIVGVGPAFALVKLEGDARAIPSRDHVCTACPAVADLDLKFIVHRGPTVRQSVGASTDLLGPAVTVAHRLLKNTIRDEIGYRPYLFLTEPAASALGLPDLGRAHGETYADAGTIGGRVLVLG
ncbi:MAG TPA: DUF2652 domain-containing protein [Candidatus Limnocylindrales bacterium]|nr:DUF2652 domain-containing protein [Candidatus Limnocylindrales bacterium]